MNVFEDRTFSSFPLSIPTGLALESLFEPTIDRYDNDKVINKLDINNYKYYYFNIYTLIRNIINSTIISKKEDLIYSKYLYNVILDEIEIIESLFTNEMKCKIVWYMPDYSNIIKIYNSSEFKIKENYKYQAEILKIHSLYKRLLKNSIKIYEEHRLPKTTESCLITTHLYIDLCNVKSINKLTVLESHTGNSKTLKDFNTKYHPIGKKSLDPFPFIEELLFLLGDNTLVRPIGLTHRNMLYQTALDNNWNYRTTKDKIVYDLKKSTLIDLVKNFKSIY